MNPTATTAKRPQTAAEFLTWPGDGRAKRYQLVDGEVKAMAPASAVHGLIQATLVFLIKQKLRESGSVCKVFAEPAVTPRLRPDDNVRVPAIGVTCTPVRPGQIVVQDPILLVEILSPSNKSGPGECLGFHDDPDPEGDRGRTLHEDRGAHPAMLT